MTNLNILRLYLRFSRPLFRKDLLKVLYLVHTLLKYSTESGFLCSLFYRFRLFIFLVLQIPAFHVPGFTDSGYSCSGFCRFRLSMFLVLQIPAFYVPGFYRFRLFMFLVLQIPAFHVPSFLVPCSVPRPFPDSRFLVLQIAA